MLLGLANHMYSLCGVIEDGTRKEPSRSFGQESRDASQGISGVVRHRARG